MRKYALSHFSFDNFKEMILQGDNSKDAQIRADKEGYIYLSQKFVGNQSLNDIKFRLPTLSGDLVGSLCADSNHMKSIYDLIIRNKDNTGYIDPEID
ncbi:hypothetical protein CLNEO_09990 [Anaerotignum neopropionicum]|uniref:Uncharacterized protein n=1 Tax=Anaerotignum neopropionicum TaxID=36847 RepID=A0A136WH68_9FIRM|nr:hypothetical protein [Anaerotignum neopropionicum]KXL53773.1 hypothetical protein CLNEO_09990 [Anaerotignum neopropionicum]